MNIEADFNFPEVGDDGLPLTSLPQDFYISEKWFERDIARVFRQRWLFVCHISEIPNSGDFTTFELAKDSIVIARDRRNEINAFHNVCRHRGTRLCETGKGHAKLFVCPFHNWTYNLDGTLRGAPHMPDLEKDLHAAKPVWCEVWNGMVFINLVEEKPKSVADYFASADFSGHQLANAKVVASKNYPTAANWKLSAETYQECYHCAVVHPQSLGRLLQPLTNYVAYEEVGADSDDTFLSYSADMREGAFVPGVETQSWDGKFVSKVMLGDGKTVQPPKLLAWFPNFSIAAFADVAFIIDWIPVSATETIFRTRWLVHQDAVEGVDYNLEDVMKMADTFNKEDKVIVEKQHLGVCSSAYVPGPYQIPLEDDLRRFLRQYLNLVR